MEAGIAVVVGTAAKTVEIVSSAELKAAGAAGIGAAKTVAVVSGVESKAAAAVAAVAAAAGFETTKTAAVAAVLLDILRPHAGTGNTGLEQSATDCVAQRVVAGVVGEFGFVAIQGAEVNLQLRNTVPQADMTDSDLDMKGSESDPGHQCTVEY
jgi:hypothetical protein